MGNLSDRQKKALEYCLLSLNHEIREGISDQIDELKEYRKEIEIMLFGVEQR